MLTRQNHEERGGCQALMMMMICEHADVPETTKPVRAAL
jgi:hypothetical protein